MDVLQNDLLRDAMREQLRTAFARWMVLTAITAQQEGMDMEMLHSELQWLLARSELLCRRSSAVHLRKILGDFATAEEWVHRSLRHSLLPFDGGAEQGEPLRCQCGAVLLRAGSLPQCGAFCAASAQPPANYFQRALRAGSAQLGLWSTLPSAHASARLLDSAWDWVLLDTTHLPTDVPHMLAQLRALTATRPPPYPGCSQAVVRLPWQGMAHIGPWIDQGAQTLLLPGVDSAAVAHEAVQAVRAATRQAQATPVHAGGVSMDPQAGASICLLVEVEVPENLAQLPAIASVEGVDGVFVGPMDRLASLGAPGRTERLDVEAALQQAIVTIRACGKAAGMLAVHPQRAQACMEAGAQFVAMGMDQLLLHPGSEPPAERLRRQARLALGASMY